MITLKEFMEAIKYQITDTSKYHWECYGPNARTMEYWNRKQEGGIVVNCVFDTVDQTVYEVEAWDDNGGVEYKWIHPAYIEGVAQESLSRNVDFYQSIDNRKFTYLEVPEDILEKATAMVEGWEYDTRIIVPVDLTFEHEHMLMTLAHEADMTLNQFVEFILRRKIKEMERQR